MESPGRIAVVGDLHGNVLASLTALRDIAGRLDDEPVKLVVQVGDFGYWGLDPYIRKLNKVLQMLDMRLWFLDGNHEHHDSLDRLRAQTQRWEPACGPHGGIKISDRITWLTRGSWWEWHGRMWLACGGATSMDKLSRREGHDWFRQEEISDRQELEIITFAETVQDFDSHIEVMLCHDCPSAVNLGLPVPAARDWLAMVNQAAAHRERLQHIVNAAQPSYLIHGHYHKWYEKQVDMPYGPCRVTGLNMDGEPGNWMILDTKSMDWKL